MTEKLILENISFAEKLAKFQFKKTPPQVQYDELKSAAYMGLVDAANRYDGRGNFKSFASFRILGEIKDYLRSLKWDKNTNILTSLSVDVEEEADVDSFDEVLGDLVKNVFIKKIFKMYFGENLTMTAIAKKLNLSSARISQIIKESLKQLRKIHDQ